VVAVQGVAAVIVAAVLVFRGIGGADAKVAYGTAAWFLLVGGGVLGAGWALWTGRRWGRGIAVFAQLLLLPVAWYMGVGSQRWLYGIPVGVVALATLALLFSPSALRWLGAQGSSANADNSGPDTR
jgi:hypothetical protein